MIAFVCDQAPQNQSLFTHLKVSESSPFILYKENKIFALFDVPHLTKSVRNNFKKYTIEFGEHKLAKWSHVEQLYAIDSGLKYRITNAHMEAKGLNSMRVKLATQILSHSVAAGISLLTAIGNLPAEAANTADFIGQMDELFDSCNSCTLSDKKEFRKAVQTDSKHTEMWTEKLKWINSWHFIKDGNKRVTPPCKKGWKITINAVTEIFAS